MLEYFLKIWNYIKTNKILLGVCAGLLAVIIALGLIMGKMSANKKIADVNYKAATEQIKELKTQNGDLLVEKQSYIGNIKDLEEQLGISKEEVKSLQKTLDNKILYISNIESNINITPTVVHDTTVVYKDSTYNYAFKFHDEWYNLDGHSQVTPLEAKTWIDNFNTSVPLKVGLTDDWEIFVTTTNPYVKFTDVQGAVLDKSVYLQQKRVRRFGVSIYAGFNTGYDLIGKKMYAGPGVGIGVSYILF